MTNFEPGPIPLWGTGRGFATYPQQEATRHLAVTTPCPPPLTSSVDCPLLLPRAASPLLTASGRGFCQILAPFGPSLPPLSAMIQLLCT